MKIIQSFWSKPYLQGNTTNIELRGKGGWLHEKVFKQSILLSFFTINKHHGEVHLITDDLGKSILIDELKIPYSSVSLELNQLHNFDHRLWAIGKLLAYSLQSEPFLHIDNDVFLYKPLPENLFKSDVYVQNLDKNASYYASVHNCARALIDELPPFLNEYLTNGGLLNEAYGCNAGIIGGKNLGVFKTLKKVAFELVNRINLSEERNDFGLINVFLEQSTLYALAHNRKLEIGTLFPEMNEEFDQVLSFERVPECGYIHVVGKAKRNILANERIRILLDIEVSSSLNTYKMIDQKEEKLSQNDFLRLITGLLCKSGLIDSADRIFEYLKTGVLSINWSDIQNDLAKSLQELWKLLLIEQDFAKEVDIRGFYNDHKESVISLMESKDILSIYYELNRNCRVFISSQNWHEVKEIGDINYDSEESFLYITRPSLLPNEKYFKAFSKGFDLLVYEFSSIKNPITGYDFLEYICRKYEFDPDESFKMKLEQFFRNSVVYQASLIISQSYTSFQTPK